jgi:hypothetical protein
MLASDYVELKRRLDAAICPLCTECRPDGSCGLDRVRECPIKTHLDRLLYTAVVVNSDRMDPYVEEVRAGICERCNHRETPADRCDVRNEGHCALDALLLPALDVIDQFVSEIEGRAANTLAC